MRITANKQNNDRKLFNDAIKALHGTISNAGAHLTVDSATRAAYDKQIKAMANELRTKALARKISWAKAAKQANEARNVILDMFRWRSTPVGKAFAQSMKAQGTTLNELIARKTLEIHGKDADFNRLTDAQKNNVYGEIVKSSGKPNVRLSSIMKKLGTAGRGLIILSLAISIYNIATADDKVDAVKKEVAVVAGGIGGGIAGGAVAGLACGPGAPVCVTIGAFIGGVLGAFGVSFFW